MKKEQLINRLEKLLKEAADIRTEVDNRDYEIELEEFANGRFWARMIVAYDCIDEALCIIDALAEDKEVK